VEEDEEWHHTFGLLQLQGNLIDTVGATIQLGCSLSLSLALSLVLDGDWSTEYYSTPERGELIRINISMRLLITSSQPHQGLRLINSGRSLFTSKKKSGQIIKRKQDQQQLARRTGTSFGHFCFYFYLYM
jgi:hypothetical protein